MADTTSLSNFPNEIDTFDRVSDISEQHGTLEKSQVYKDKIDKGNYAEAEQYLQNNEDLAQCAVNASMFNKHSDAIVALEEKVISDRQLAVNGLTEVDNKINTVYNTAVNGLESVDNKICVVGQNLNTVHSEFSSDSSTNSVLLNTVINDSVKDSTKIKGKNSYILVECNSNNELELSLDSNSLKDLYIIQSNLAKSAHYTYNNKEVYQKLIITSISNGNNTIILEGANLGLSAPPHKVRIIDVSGFIKVSAFMDSPARCYPLNSSFCNMYWVNSISTNNVQNPSSIHIDITDSQKYNQFTDNEYKTISAEIVVKFVND